MSEKSEIKVVFQDLIDFHGCELENYEGEFEQDQVIEILRQGIESLVDHDFNQFIQLLYKMDVSEDKVMKIMADAPVTERTSLIAKLIYDRQLQKVITRKKYRRPRNEDHPDDEESW